MAVTLVTTIDVSSARSYDAYDDADNTVRYPDLDTLLPGYTNYRLTGVGWNVSLTAYSPSRLSEMVIAIERPDRFAGVWMAPGYSDATSGTGTYTNLPLIDLVSTHRDFAFAEDHVARIEFFELIDNTSNAPDGLWNSGTIILRVEADPVPEPTSLMALSLGVIALAKRRRK